MVDVRKMIKLYRLLSTWLKVLALGCFSIEVMVLIGTGAPPVKAMERVVVISAFVLLLIPFSAFVKRIDPKLKDLNVSWETKLQRDAEQQL